MPNVMNDVSESSWKNWSVAVFYAWIVISWVIWPFLEMRPVWLMLAHPVVTSAVMPMRHSALLDFDNITPSCS